MYTFHPFVRFVFTVSIGYCCSIVSKADGQQKSTTLPAVNRSPYAAEPFVAADTAQKDGPVQPSAQALSGTPLPSIDPFKKRDSLDSRRSIVPSTRDPFDPNLREVDRTLNEPISFVSLPLGELANLEIKIRIMRIGVLTNAIEIVKAQLEAGANVVGLMREYAELIEDLTTLEFQKAKSSDERQVAIQKAIDAWRLEEKHASSRLEESGTALAVYFGARYRLRWEQALVKELRAAAEAKSLSQPVIQSSVVQYPIVEQQTVYYPSAPPATVVGQPSPTYYYPTQPTYQYPRSYRTR